MEDGLTRAAADVHDHLVVLETGFARGVRDELEHAPRFVGWELTDVAKAVDVTFRKDEKVHRRLRIDVLDGDETVARVDVVSLRNELAEEAVRPRCHGFLPP
jgi:hypothetical protein